MVLFSSTINSTIRSTTDLVILCHANKREIVPLPKTYQDAIDIAREVFGLGGNAELILKTSDPDACRGQPAVINKRAWDSLRSVLANIEVEVKDEQQRSTSRAETTHSAGGSESDVDENEDFLVLKPSKSSLKGKARSATKDEENTSSLGVGAASESGSWRGASSGPSETVEEPDPRSSIRERQLRIEKPAKAATKAEPSKDRKAAPAPTSESSAQFTSSADEDAPPRHQSVQVKQEQPHTSRVPSGSKRTVSGQEPTTTEASQSQSQTGGSGSSDKFLITIVHRGSGKEALFRTRRNLPVSKVLDTACTQFGLSRRTAKLFIVDVDPLWPMVKTSVPCKRDQTMAEVGAKENSQFEIEGEFEEDGSEE